MRLHERSNYGPLYSGERQDLWKFFLHHDLIKLTLIHTLLLVDLEIRAHDVLFSIEK